MSDQHCGYIVTLGSSISEQSSKRVIEALRMIVGVVDVQPIVDDFSKAIGYSQARCEIANRLLEVVKEIHGWEKKTP